MIKLVLQSIPWYVMSIFRLPNTLLDEIEKMMNAFWWGNGGANNRGMHWLLWDKLSVHKRAQVILNIPLFPQVTEDKLVWNPKKNGHYSVKSAYRLCVEEIADNSHLWKNGYWGGIWKLKVPPKVKSMVWRVCRECLPTRVRLNKKGVTCPSTCVLCNDPHEDNYQKKNSTVLQQ